MSALNVVKNFGTTQHSTDINHQKHPRETFPKKKW